MVKKLDEIKEAISTSTNSTPVKILTERSAIGDMIEGDGESTDGSEGGERHRKISSEVGSNKGSHANLKDFVELPENLFSPPSEDTSSE